ncbi:MAG TPA: COX15/CtaA family protein [Caulobacterales bacterium]|nr:COX15/CtaA family protein [Caulobacterales bacterium]
MTGAKPDKLVGAWLIAICVLVFAMVMVGGATRLTQSGLSITEWKPVTGVLPPLGDEDWRRAFEAYRQTTQYAELNRGMSLGEFQGIFWWEWAHRLLGRVIGFVFLIPFLAFWATGRLKGRFFSVLALFAAGGLQGFVGWLMVQSGLEGRTEVNPAWLAAHLAVAFIIMALALWLALDAFAWPRERRTLVAPRALPAVFVAALFVQIMFGALLAGAHAGPAYPDWPMIGGEWIPRSYAALELTDNHATQHFNHRSFGYVVVLLALTIAWFGWRRGEGAGRKLALAMGVGALAQACLGVATVLAVTPLGLALAHQAGAAMLWLLGVALLRTSREAGGNTIPAL